MDTDTPGAQLRFIKLSPNAILPTRGSEYSAGLDLYASEAVEIPAGKSAGVLTGLAVEIPLGFYGRIAPRSGLAKKHLIDTLAGVVDSDYRGEIICLLMNLGTINFQIAPGDRIAQLIVESIVLPKPVWAEELSQTLRADGGFGSTGHNINS